MAVVIFSRRDLEKLVGRKITEKEYREVIPMMGTPMEGLNEDEVSFEVFPNRPDLLAVEGFARALQGFLGMERGLVGYEVKKSDYEVVVDSTALGKRPCVSFAVAKGLKFDDDTVAAFMQLQDKIGVTIGRRRKKCSIGTYEFDDIEFPVHYVEKGLDFKFIPLGFSEEMALKKCLEVHPKCIEYKHLTKDWKTYPMYIDNKGRALCMLPFTNAEFAKIKPDTKNIFIEVTGTDWKAVDEMMNVVVTALVDRGAKIYEVKAKFPKDVGKGKERVTPDLKPWEMGLNINYVNKLLDLDMKPDEIKTELEKMRFGFRDGKVQVPPYRTDVMHPIDLVEDIAIAHGYEKFEPRIPQIPTIGEPNPAQDFCNQLREIMVGLGFQETVNFVLSNEEKEFRRINKKPVPVVEIMNPKTVDYTIARTSLIPGLLETFSQNTSSEMPQRVFEIGTAVAIDEKSETGAVNVKKLGGGILHSNANYSEMIAVVEAFFRNLGKSVEVKEGKNPAFIEGRCVDLFVDGKKAGEMGEVAPDVLANFGLEYPATIFELDVELLRNK